MSFLIQEILFLFNTAAPKIISIRNKAMQKLESCLRCALSYTASKEFVIGALRKDLVPEGEFC
jgi:hypothetical protein